VEAAAWELPVVTEELLGSQERVSSTFENVLAKCAVAPLANVFETRASRA